MSDSIDRARRQWLQHMLRSAVLVAAGTVNRYAVAMSGRPIEQGIRDMRGDVRMRDQPVKPGALVEPSDTIRTGADSHATVVIGEDAFLIRDNSVIEFKGRKDSMLVEMLRITTGKVLMVMGKTDFGRTVETSVATIGIRGTGLYLDARPRGLYVCTCYGIVEIVPTAAPERREIVRTLHHDAPRFVTDRSGADAIRTAPVIDHSDEELIVLEELVGRRPDFLDFPYLDRY